MWIDVTGAFLDDCQVVSTPMKHVTDESAAVMLWELSEKLVGEEFKLERQ